MDNTTLRILAEDAIDNIGYAGSDSALWTSNAKDRVKALADALEAAEAELTRRDTIIARAMEEAHVFLRTQDVNYEEDNFAAGQVDAAECIRRILAAAPVSSETVERCTHTGCSAEMVNGFWGDRLVHHDDDTHAVEAFDSRWAPSGAEVRDQHAAPVSLEAVKAEAWDEGNEACRAVYVEGRKSGPVVNPHRNPEEADHA